ncbi:lebercilin [Salmo salar]|uniref:Lebercilin-like n=1 Tax=Salmo salar TaxID=8030 RepID=A0A1S3M810_SALSA|nr:lebercilin [Salmo salar]XP_013999097.1 lebercilin [Salmo salar]|eukprot:XP_013999096.1 PREDICTED: lebercilin-like [Salmo salar]
MDTENIPHPYEDNRDAERQSRQSRRSTAGKGSEASLRTLKRDKSRDGERDERDSCAGDQAKTRTQELDPDRDRMSDREHRRSSSFYSEDYENLTPSERTLSPYSRTPSPSPRRKGPRAKRVSSSPLHKAGVRRGVYRPPRLGAQPQRPQRWGVRTESQSLIKDSTAPPKDLDLVTKRMLSARLLKINELRNALAELQLHTDQLTKENRILRQLQHRQEKALQRYDDTESEIAQLLSSHANETTALRERLRRTQERERVTERRLKDTQEQLQRSQSSLGRLRRLAEQQELGPREELTRRLEQERVKDQENQLKIKDLERRVELSSSSYQRQLATERRKTISTQDRVSDLQEEVERLTNKLKEKERELDTRNIYANRLLKPSPRNIDNTTKRKGPSKSSSKAVQTVNENLSLDFPSPPPAVTDGNYHYNDQAPDDYLTLKPGVSGTPYSSREVDVAERRPKETEERKEREERERVEKEREREKQRNDPELDTLEEKNKRLRDGWEKEEEESKRRLYKEEENRKRRGQVQEEVARRNQEALASQEVAEAERRRKEQLLAKLREIDKQNEPPQNAGLFSEVDPEPLESSSGSTARSPPRFSDPRNQNPSIFSFTEPEEMGGLRGGAGSREGGKSGRGGPESGLGPGAGTGTGRRGVRAQNSNEDLAFGSYAPSFGRPAPRGGTGFPTPPPPSALDALLGRSEREKERGGLGPGLGKERKSTLLQQLFGPPSSPSPISDSPPDVLLSPPTSTLTGPRNCREGFFPFEHKSPAPAGPLAPFLSSLHVTESRPTVRAIASFDDDIEELKL